MEISEVNNLREGISKNINILLGPTRLGPSYPKLPNINEFGETRISGLYIKGDAAGTPLIKVGLNEGFDWVNNIQGDLKTLKDNGSLDYQVIIVGSGATGFAAAKRCHELDISYLLLESERFASTIQNFTKGKPLFNEPHSLEQRGSIWFEECSKEELLEKWNEQREEFDMNLKEFEKVEDIKGTKGNFKVITNKGSYTGGLVLLSIGKAGNPRKTGVPGEKEHAERIFHTLADADIYTNSNVLIYGGGDVACEAALALSDHNIVTMVTIDKEFIYPKKRNADACLEKVKEGKLKLHFDTSLEAITSDHVVIMAQESGEKKEVLNDVVFEMIGAIPPIGFFKKVGIDLANSWHGNKWIAIVIGLLTMTGISIWAYELGVNDGSFYGSLGGFSFISGLGVLAFMGYKRNKWAWLCLTLILSYVIYAAKSSSPKYPFHWIGSDAIADYLGSGFFEYFIPKAVIALKGAPSFWYSALYTFLVLFFGIKAMKRWGIDHKDNHQIKRFISIMAFQIIFFIIVNMVLSVLIGKYYWRGWGLYQPFPLFYNTFFWWYEGDPVWIKWGFIGFGLFLTFVAIPIFVRFHGMRFCTWVCGCGGLAETLGDTWRHLAPKGLKSQKWEFQGPLVLIWAFISLAVIFFAFGTDGNNGFWSTYDYVVDFWLVAVIPIGLYPFFGGKTWCRYWCPLAHYMKILSAWFGKLKIVSNNKCISCTQCSTYCQVGVDVMKFAKNQETFDNTNSSCIHCGICITVCPMDVLSFDNGSKKVSVKPTEILIDTDKDLTRLMNPK